MTTIDSKKRDRKGAQLALEMEPALMERLRAYSATDGRSISTLVRRWIELGLDGKTDLAESQIPRTEFTDLVDIVTLMRDEVAELAKWRQTQDTLLPKEPDTAFALDVSVAELERRWGISRNALKARAKTLGIELQRNGPTLTVWPKDRVADGDQLDAHCKSGGALATFKLQEKTSDNLHPMAELATRWGITANTVSRRLAFLGIKPERRGNLRYIEAGEIALGDALQAHIVSGKPMELFMPTFQQAKNHILQDSEGVSKRAEWKQCAWYVRPSTYSKLKRYVNSLQEMERNVDSSDVVDSALQMWMDDVK